MCPSEDACTSDHFFFFRSVCLFSFVRVTLKVSPRLGRRKHFFFSFCINSMFVYVNVCVAPFFYTAIFDSPRVCSVDAGLRSWFLFAVPLHSSSSYPSPLAPFSPPFSPHSSHFPFLRNSMQP